MQEWHDLKVDNINISLVCSATLGKLSFTKARLDRKTTQGFCLITSLLKNRASTKDKGTNSLAMNKAKIFFKFFSVRVVLAIRNSTSKKVQNV
jgi:hypothetical protein